MVSLTSLPSDLPAPEDNGEADHLAGLDLPQISLSSTSGGLVAPAQASGWMVLYFYPMTGRPDIALPDNWDAIPGARGCTPQSCSFRDHYQELQSVGAAVYGVSSQSTDYQREALERLHLPFPLLSDETLQYKNQLRLPTLTVDGMELYKRLTLIANSGSIKKVFFPVFPPDQNAANVLDWLKNSVQS